VSNETQPFESYGLEVRYLQFNSDTVAYGSKDVALRCNIGIWWARYENVLIQSDDQIASPSMIYHAEQRLREDAYFWANHRIVDFEANTVDEILGMEAAGHVSRETPVPPAWHGYYSCYSGMLGARRDFLIEAGGIDMAFNGRHGGEDQQLGKRLMMSTGDSKVFIIEPPYGWIDQKGNQKEPWGTQATNVCTHPEYEDVFINGLTFRQCQHCPERLYSGPEEDLFTGRLIIPFDPEAIDVSTS
jgi:hypothetical protein